MESIRNMKLVVRVGFMALALCLAGSQGKAQGTYTGTFMLPFEARLGSAILPPGGYTISMDPESVRPINREKSFRINSAGQNIGVALGLAEMDVKINGLRDNRSLRISETKHVISPYSAAQNERTK